MFFTKKSLYLSGLIINFIFLTASNLNAESINSNVGYDIRIDKYVNNKKTYAGFAGEVIEYKLQYRNLNGSKKEAKNPTIFDNYDQTKIELINYPKYCFDNGDMLICNIASLPAPSNNARYPRQFSYTARIKNTAVGLINNGVEIRPNPDEDINQSNDVSYASVAVR